MIDTEDLVEILWDFKQGNATATEVVIKLEGMVYEIVDSRMKEWFDGNS